MIFAEFFFKIRDGTEDDEKLFDYEVVIKQNRMHTAYEYSIDNITIDHEHKKIYIWIIKEFA